MRKKNEVTEFTSNFRSAPEKPAEKGAKYGGETETPVTVILVLPTHLFRSIVPKKKGVLEYHLDWKFCKRDSKTLVGRNSPNQVSKG